MGAAWERRLGVASLGFVDLASADSRLPPLRPLVPVADFAGVLCMLHPLSSSFDRSALVVVSTAALQPLLVLLCCFVDSTPVQLLGCFLAHCRPDTLLGRFLTHCRFLLL